MIHIFKTRHKTNEYQYVLFPRSIISLIFLILNTGNAQTQVELSVPSSLSLGKAPLTISCRSLKTGAINRIQIERKPATGSVYSTLVYVGEGFTPIVRDGKENGDSLLMEQMVLGRINSYNVNITILKGKNYTFFFIARICRRDALVFLFNSICKQFLLQQQL